MATTTYRVIQDSHQIGTITREQAREAIRAAIAMVAKRDAKKKPHASTKKNRAHAKS